MVPWFSVARMVMRALSLMCCFAFMSIARGEEPMNRTDDAFSVTNYKLAFVQVGQQSEVVNEYVPHGETLENWTTMIAVRQWPKAKALKEIVGPYVRNLQPLYVRDAQVFRPENAKNGNDVVFEFYLAPQDKSYLEYNLIRFVVEEESEGVKSYQFAVRGDYDLDAAVKFNSTRLKARLDTIAGLTLGAETEPLGAGDDAEVADREDDEEEESERDDDADK
jgi:hypothetical protein